MTVERVEPGDWRDDHVLVRCPRCSECARVSYVGDDLRLTCTHCGHADSIPKPRRHFEQGPSPSLHAYNEGEPPFGAALWLETECCGRHRLRGAQRAPPGLRRSVRPVVEPRG